MSILSHFQTRLSIGLLLGSLSIAGPWQVAVAEAPQSFSPYYGRWTVDEDKPNFSKRGLDYKMIDIAPCGKNFCGVSINASGTCGPVLFRFLSKRAQQQRIQGHGKWGDAKKNVVIFSYDNPETKVPEGFELYLGDGYDFGNRSSSMPKFHANYRLLSAAKCRVS
jgi:hypothetical protein